MRFIFVHFVVCRVSRVLFSRQYDELVPADWTTQHGGFYINQGELHYRPMADKYGFSIHLNSLNWADFKTALTTWCCFVSQ